MANKTRFEKWLLEFLQEDLGYNELDAGEIKDKLVKQIKKEYLPVLQEAQEAERSGRNFS